jgi:hypothetical protein
MRVPKKDPLIKYPPCPSCGKPISLDDSLDPPHYECRLCQVSFYLQDGGMSWAQTGNPNIGPEDFEKYFKKEFPHFKETLAWRPPK